MKTFCALVTCLAIAGITPLAAQNKPGKFDASKLVGKWNYVSGVNNGNKVAPENLKKQTVAFTKDKITLKNGDTFVIKYELDSTKKPINVKLEILESPFGAGAKAAGIIEVTGDEMRFCYSPMNDTPPKAFEAKEGSNAHLFILKRAK